MTSDCCGGSGANTTCGGGVAIGGRVATSRASTSSKVRSLMLKQPRYNRLES
jgi:hypothetical protein